jgi:ABC-2 type transport system ATP-binding protein
MIFSGDALSKSYGAIQALDGVSISCQAGDIHGVIGANGAGKTTLFKVLLGLITPDSGSVTFYHKGQKKAGGIIEKPALYGYLNAAENLKVFAGIQGISLDRDATLALIDRVGLSTDRMDPVRNFSTGMKQRLGIAVALINQPGCLILDEPFSGLDPMGIESLRRLILRLAKEEGLCILLSSHILDEMSRICTKLSIMHNGQFVQQGPAGNLTGTLSKAYRFYGPQITESNTLKRYGAISMGNCMTLEISHEQLPELMRELGDEQVLVTAMIPDFDLSGIYNPTRT